MSPDANKCASFPSTAERVLAELDRRHLRLKQEAPDRYRCDSPFRPGSDSHAFQLTLSGPEHGSYYDHVSHEKGSLYQLAEALGIERPRPTTRQLVATYDYLDSAGTLLYQTCRFEPGKHGRAKDFLQRRPDPSQPDGWAWNTKGITKVLYRLSALEQAIAANQTIYLVEGEKDAARLALAGLAATTNVGGAGKWQRSYSAALRGADVVILPDNDEPGHQHAAAVAQALCGQARRLRIIALPHLPPKGDVSDWLNAGHQIEELLALVEVAADYVPEAEHGDNLSQPEAKTLESDSPHNTDLGNARRLVCHFGDRIRYVHSWGTWLIYDGSRWIKDETGEIHRLARSTIRHMYAEAAKIEDSSRRKDLARWAMASESASKLSAMVQLAQSEPGIAVHHSALDKDPWLLNCRNGTIDLRSGKLRQHCRDDLLTKRIEVSFNPYATAPTWMRFLHRITQGDTALGDYLARAVGYTLTGDVTEQCLFFLHGGGSNGKSTFIEALVALLGDYFRKAPTEMIMLQRMGGAIPNDLARLPGARMVTTGELAQSRRLDEAKVKDMTGGDTLTARFMREEYFDFQPVFKLWMYGNHKPKITGDDYGIWRRIRLIPFNAVISDTEKDPRLKAKLFAEMPGILAWAINGCIAWQREGLTPPEIVSSATAAYRAEQDVIAAFIEDRCVLHANASVGVSDLYRAYVSWCDQSGENTMSQRDFAHRMETRGLISKRTKKAFIRIGIGLLDPDQTDFNSPEQIDITEKKG
ncbi:MAG: DNA primase [Candidatus Viridilinea halotolerans]|uniref:DNA primase n=1 Tax=Candidatus Viridilinea halotolerans TaxID=2491704 RepID=A0A426TUI2_9CHLR|nr:MAG: DNA primase [Candidatus Viridilinea halotolerans]